MATTQPRRVFRSSPVGSKLRVAAQKDAFWYGLADPAWRVVKVNGWRVVDRPPILFRRYRNTAAQVEPARNGDIWTVLNFVNLSNDQERLLLVTYLVTCLAPGIAHPVPVATAKRARQSQPSSG